MTDNINIKIKCKFFHKWDTYKNLNRFGVYMHLRTTKVCIKCGEERVKEQIW